MGKGSFIIVLLFVIAVLVGGVLYFNNVDEMDSNNLDSSNDINKDDEASTEIEDSMRSGITSNPDTLAGELFSVNSDQSSGTAYVLRSDETLNHLVNAFLPELSEDEFYEGWLVKEKPSLLFFSTGRFEMISEGQYQLAFSSENLYQGYNNIVVSRETVDDKTPEEHILEGVVK